MKLHREGNWPILITIAFVLFINLSASYQSVISPVQLFLLVGGVILIIFVMQFFRNPSRHTKIDENKIYSPADGKVVVIEKVFEDEYLREDRIQLSIFMSPLDVHANKSPVNGEVIYYKHHQGKYLVAWHPKSSSENERSTLVFNTKKGELLLRLIAGAMARRIKCYKSMGDVVKQGEEISFIKFGSRADLLLPKGADVKVKIGDKVKAGLTVLAEY
ncbi:MAG TPA: phosphatidylserine decarboxylase family protein [Cyclobacteriaceae bacterium]